MHKIMTFAIPCYNSAAYMDTCIQSILDGADGAEDIQIVIVDDVLIHGRNINNFN